MATQPGGYKKTNKAYLRMLELLMGMLGLAVVAALGFTSLIEPTSAQGKSVVVAAANTVTPIATTPPGSSSPATGSRPAIGSNGGQNQGQGQRQGRGFGPGGTGGRKLNLPPAMLQAAADVLGFSSDQLNSELAAGKTLSQIAASNNVDLQKLKATMLASIKGQIDAQVQSGRMSQTQADQLYQSNSAALDSILNRSLGGNSSQQFH